MLNKVKVALRISTTSFDTEIQDLIDACLLDLGIAGVVTTSSTTDKLILQCVITYCKWRFGEPENPDRLQAMYEMQKAQLQVATGYTDWGDQ